MAKKKGLGDVAEMLFKPIAKAIDKVAGTDLENCEGCKQRKEVLNNITAKGKTPKKGERKKVNNLSLEQTEALRNYFKNGSNQYMDARTQKKLLSLVEKEANIRFSTTSCSSCWRTKVHPYLEMIAVENGILNGTLRR